MDTMLVHLTNFRLGNKASKVIPITLYKELDGGG